jgi:hypothetical protein
MLANRSDERSERLAKADHLSERTRWAIVVVFAIAMAWVEAASVLYIRALVDRIEPYQAEPLPLNDTQYGALGNVELVREAATLVMIATLGAIAGRTWRRRAGYAALAFGVWDIFYYVFLRSISGWPRTLLDWDILFLLPLPWWGPVLAPVSIALVMILWGTLATQSGDDATDARWASALAGVGIMLALAVFMVDAWRALPHGRDAVLRVLPDDFNWPLFCVALMLMASPALHQVAFLRLTSSSIGPDGRRMTTRLAGSRPRRVSSCTTARSAGESSRGGISRNPSRS